MYQPVSGPDMRTSHTALLQSLQCRRERTGPAMRSRLPVPDFLWDSSSTAGFDIAVIVCVHFTYNTVEPHGVAVVVKGSNGNCKRNTANHAASEKTDRDHRVFCAIETFDFRRKFCKPVYIRIKMCYHDSCHNTSKDCFVRRQWQISGRDCRHRETDDFGFYDSVPAQSADCQTAIKKGGAYGLFAFELCIF